MAFILGLTCVTKNVTGTPSILIKQVVLTRFGSNVENINHE